jgi:exodeoxyribonuclease V alpha subunit
MNQTADPVHATLNHIRFKKEAFIIGMFQGEKEEFAALGNIMNAEVGMTYKLWGKWIQDTQWGRQLKVKTYEAVVPKSSDGIYRYVVRVCKWVGPSVGKALVEKYGAQTLDVLRLKPEQVAAEIKGITIERAKEIQILIQDNEAIEGALVELEKLIGGAGLRQSLPMDLVQKWGSNAVPMLKDNPYLLIEMKQIGFPSADRIAVDRFKVQPQSIFRQQAAVIHFIREKTHGEGHVWVDEKGLVDDVRRLIRCDPTEGLARAVEKGAVVRDSGEGTGLVALVGMARDEKYIAEKVKEILG